MNEFGQKGEVPLLERLSVSPEEASALTGIGLTSIREAISSGDLKAKKHGRRTIILPDDLRVWLKTLPDARKSIEVSPAYVFRMTYWRAGELTDLRHRRRTSCEVRSLGWPLELADWFYVMFELALDCRLLPNRSGD